MARLRGTPLPQSQKSVYAAINMAELTVSRCCDGSMARAVFYSSHVRAWWEDKNYQLLLG